ncbi:MAG: aminoacyl-tRNA hydrolase [Chitinophagaceae bacterium]|nr:MAG: aminoacyl-tRNA hydrolase [Chitinophagaceae bacterium]
MSRQFTQTELEPEIFFKTSRSSGKGGQHVNKTESSVQLYFDIDNSELLSDEEKALIRKKEKNRIDRNGVLSLHVQERRSQYMNKKRAIHLLAELLKRALKKEKKRIPTKPGKKSREKRLKIKTLHAEKKKLRKKFRRDRSQND